MSGFVLIFHRRGTPVDPRVVKRLLGALTHRGPDGCDVHHRPSISLGHQHFWTTPEEAGERQPLTAPPSLDLVFDGRLDNRTTLQHELGCHEAQGRHLSDARLVLLAYQRWAEASFARLLGPFALALYDAGRRRVICARDPLGGRTLFYHLTATHLIIASEEQAILTHPAVTATLHTPRLATYFAAQAPAPGTTFFEAVHELLPAHAMVIETETSRTWRYWDFDPGKTIRYRTNADYAEHFQALLHDSVGCRLRASSTPTVMMSGGLDSTSIAALAAQQHHRASPTQRLSTVSFVFDEFVSCDERAYMEAMTQRYQLQATQVLGDDAWPLNHIETWPLNPNSPENDVYRHLQTRLYQQAHAASHHVMLSGEGGDQLYLGAESWLTDLLAERQFARAWRDSRLHIRYDGLLRFARRTGLHRLIGAHWLRRLWPKTDRSWLTTEAKQALPVDDTWPPSALMASRPKQYQSLLGLSDAHGICVERHYASQAGVEIRYPYRDRRLVEFMLAIPTHQLYDHGRYKPILRHAMKGLLPEPILNRVQPTLLYPLFVHSITKAETKTMHQLLHHPNRIWPQYVRADWLNPAGLDPNRPRTEAFILWLCICLELWRLRFGNQFNL
ncbi:MAG: hypothetical protein ETSY1_19905 [Candidatus Entotheonella factor]|uniref:asparagine synthase (glutamine-hydrolyzing) n=1 Tax=Entotheonella factor TaxID=1429438 RepID=W4LJL1_ENTF1|nr:MAG: hypothetical protein ETSY1_19905 [Candidatus Entotheonella factor]